MPVYFILYSIFIEMGRGNLLRNTQTITRLTFSLDAERGGRQTGEKKAGPLHLVRCPSGVLFGVSFT